MSIEQLIRRVMLLIVLPIAVMAASAVPSQRQAPTNTPTAPLRVPSALDRYLDALGNRFRTPGKERTIYAGEVIDGSGRRSQAVVTHQFGARVRLEGFKPDKSILAFDGQRGRGGLSRSEDLILEAFISDTAEGLFASMEAGAAVRLLGTGFGPDPRRTPNYFGPRYDIYDVAMAVPSRPDDLVRSKLYYFDSTTGLLHSARYYDRTVSPPERVETRFSDWQRIDGSAYPGHIEHFQGGRLIFGFVASAITPVPSADVQVFR